MIIEIIILAVCVLYIINVLLDRKDKTRLPGPPKWPLVGNIPEILLANSKYPHLAMAKLAEKYGEVMGLKFGVHNACVVSSYEAMKTLLTAEELNGRYVFPFITDRAFHKNLGIVWSNGEVWRQIRKFTVKGLRDFGFGKMTSTDMALREEITELVSHIELASQSNNGILDVDPNMLALVSGNVLWRQMAGFKFAYGDETLTKLLENNAATAKIANFDNIYNAYPFLRHWFPKLTKHDEHMKVHEGFQDFMREVIENIKEKRAAREQSDPENFVEVFLDEMEKNRGNPDTHFTEEQLILVLMDVFLAGSETVGYAKAWMLLYLALNPKVQQKLKEEISRVIPKEDEISLKYFVEMPYTNAFLAETIRMSTVVPIGPARMTVEDYVYKGYKIPKGTLVMCNFYAALKDKKYWSDPDVFRPERFLNDAGTEVDMGNFVAFGMGKRVCMGESLAWDTMFMTLTLLMRKFTFSSIPGKEPTMENPILMGTLLPQRFCVHVTKDGLVD